MKVNFGKIDVILLIPTIALYKNDYDLGWKEFCIEFSWLNYYITFTF